MTDYYTPSDNKADAAAVDVARGSFSDGEEPRALIRGAVLLDGKQHLGNIVITDRALYVVKSGMLSGSKVSLVIPLSAVSHVAGGPVGKGGFAVTFTFEGSRAVLPVQLEAAVRIADALNGLPIPL